MERLSGYFQLALAMLGIIEVIRRFIFLEDFPDNRIMIGISIIALVANSLCLYLLQKSKSKEAHMQASMIFTSNDVIINRGVILAGVLVLITQSKYPDLIVGSMGGNPNSEIRKIMRPIFLKSDLLMAC